MEKLIVIIGTIFFLILWFIPIILLKETGINNCPFYGMLYIPITF